MVELQSYVTRYVLPFSVTLSTLPLFLAEESPLLPTANHPFPCIEIRDFKWESYDPNTPLIRNSDYVDYAKIVDFASKLANETRDIPPEFSRVLIDEFWNLV